MRCNAYVLLGWQVAKGDTYLLARDEDCENLFHASADHLNLFNVAQVLGLDFQTLQVNGHSNPSNGAAAPPCTPLRLFYITIFTIRYIWF